MHNFEDFLITHNVVGYKEIPITTKSGKHTSWYVNCRILSQKLSVLNDAAQYVVHIIGNLKIDVYTVDAVLGVPEGATELGNAVSRKLIEEGALRDNLFLYRVKPKEHGDVANKFWINGNVPKKVIVLEDVTTTGGSAVGFVEKLRESGVEVLCVIGLVNRLQLAGDLSVVENFQKHNIKYYSLIDANTLLPKVLASISDGKLREEIKSKIIQEYTAEYAAYNKTSPLTL